MATESFLELWTVVVNGLDIVSVSFGPPKQGLLYTQGYIDVG